MARNDRPIHGYVYPGDSHPGDNIYTRKPSTAEERRGSSLFGIIPEFTNTLTTGELINGSASETQAALARAEFEDYKKRFFPLEDELINRYDNKGLRDKAIAENTQGVRDAYQADRGIQQRRLSRYGVNLAPDQQRAINRQNQIGQVADVANVRNLTRDAYADLDEQILSGSSSSIAQISGG